MKEALQNIRQSADALIAQAADAAAVDELRVRFLGKKGELTAILKQMGRLSAEERPVVGALANEVREALTDFCRQDAEFAQAVAQGGSFKDCMAAVAKGVGGSISDLEAYRKAVRFYFKGADVRFRMEIDLCPTAEEAPRSAQKKILDIADFL